MYYAYSRVIYNHNNVLSTGHTGKRSSLLRCGSTTAVKSFIVQALTDNSENILRHKNDKCHLKRDQGPMFYNFYVRNLLVIS